MSRNFGEKNVVELYYGSLAYADLGLELRSKKQFGEGYMEITAEAYWKWAVELEGRVLTSKGQESSVRVVWASFWEMGTSALPGGRKERIEKLEIRIEDAKFAVCIDSNMMSRESFSKQKLLQVIALGDIKTGKELFLDTKRSCSEQ